MSQNYLEDVFSRYELGIAKTINHIKQKAVEPSNLESSLFLTTEEKTTLSIFLTLEILRRPEMIEKGKELFLKMSDEAIKEFEANNYALLHLFPVPELNLQDDIVFFRVFDWFADKTFRVGLTEDNSIFLGDMPFCFETDCKEMDTKPIIGVFPLTSNLVLFIYPKKNIKVECRNRLFKMNEDTVRDVQSGIANVSERWIFSYNPISSDEREIIKRAIKAE